MLPQAACILFQAATEWKFCRTDILVATRLFTGLSLMCRTTSVMQLPALCLPVAQHFTTIARCISLAQIRLACRVEHMLCQLASPPLHEREFCMPC